MGFKKDEWIEVEITFVIYRNIENGFSVLQTKLIDAENKNSPDLILKPIVVGTFLTANVGDELKVTGKWGLDNRGRTQFKSSFSEVVMPETNSSIVEYLMRTVKGIGKKKANDIVGVFGENTIDVIKTDYKRLLEVKGIGIKSADKIHEQVIGNQAYEDLNMYLIPLGVRQSDINKIYDKYGAGALNKIRSNPYSLYMESNISFTVLDGIAYKTEIPYNNHDRISTAIEHFIRMRMGNFGDLYATKDLILGEFNNFLSRVGRYGSSIIKDEELEKIIEKKVEDRSLVVETSLSGEECIYISYYNYVENSIVSLIQERVAHNRSFISDFEVFKAINNYEKRTQMKLASLQKQGVMIALKNKISIISGGPGTGKTQVINAIISALKEINSGVIIELAAPTGKAAKRMTELTGMEAKTIHRLIGLKEFSEEDGSEEVYADVLIVDESSMIDAYLFHKMLSALTEDTTLIMVGDHEQLPSVGPGLILRDLIASKRIETVRLTEIFRQEEGSNIIHNAHEIVNGKKDLKFSSNGDGDFYFIERQSERDIKEGIMISVENMMKNRGYGLEDIQILSVMNKGALGTIALNQELQKRFNNNQDSIQVGDRFFKKDDKVMQTVNNYDIEVFNGDSGIVTSVFGKGTDRTVVVEYDDDREIEYVGEMLLELTHSYAMTVHKSQGSEYPVVIIPFHNNLNILLYRNMINTGITRAKDVVVCIGDKGEMERGIDKIDNVHRNSLIKEKLSFRENSLAS